MGMLRIGRGWGITAVIVLAFAGRAAAQDWIFEWDYDFSSSVQQYFSGTDGWTSHCSSDDWTTDWYASLREVNPRTDEGGGAWDEYGYTSNYLTQEAQGPWNDVAVEVQVSIFDDDTLGLVTRMSAHGTLYLFFMTRSLRPNDGAGGLGDYGSGAYLYRIDGGVAQEVDHDPGALFREDATRGWDEDYQRLRLEAVGDTITAYYDDQPSGTWTAGNVVLSYTDSSPLPAGHVGLYSFEMGEASGYVGFRDPRVELADNDGDGWANDDDCAPDDATVHPGASEDCGDGVDNDCDGDVDDVDTDCGGTGDDDDDVSDDDDVADDDDVSDDDDAADDDAATDDDDGDDDDDMGLVSPPGGCECHLASTKAASAGVGIGVSLLIAVGIWRRRSSAVIR